MIKVAVICGVAAVSAMGAAAAVVHLQVGPQAAAAEVQTTGSDLAPAVSPPAAAQLAPQPVAAVATPVQTTTGNRDASIPKSPDGHYWAQADVNGSAVRFLVDTGATTVALSPEDARRLGFDPSTLTYAYKVTTASGEARAAHVQLSSVAVGGAKVEGVDAFVIEKGLTQSLLGMSYLGRLTNFQATQTALILRS
jgi:aspartyl protease family protein